MRIHVTGNAGSGKSTLAKNIGDILGINVYGLDKVVWQAGWKKTPINEQRRIQEELVSRPQWIIEGVSSIARQAADCIILLDFPRGVCYMRCAKRNWRYLFSSRPGLPDNCPEINIVATLVKIIWCFPDIVKPAINKDMKREEITAITISSNDELVQFITELKRHKKATQKHAVDKFYLR